MMRLKSLHIISSLMQGLFLALILFSFLPAKAQNYPEVTVTVSKEKIKVNNTLCYTHVVKEKQTLYSISRAYGVTIDEIYDLNPAVKTDGLKKNSIIFIPVKDVKDTKEDLLKDETLREKGQNEVKPKDVEAQKVKTEEVEVKSSDRKVEKSKRKKTHTVKWYESLEDIAQKYNISSEAIMLANNLPDRKLKTRQKIVIPTEEEVNELMLLKEKTAPVDTITVKDTVASDQLQKQAEADSLKRLIASGPLNKKVNVALLLPLKADGETSNRNNMDFYSGVLMAAYKLSDKEIDLNIHDISLSDTAVYMESINQSDIVIGPVSINEINSLMTNIPEGKTVISPLDQRVEKLVGSYRNLVQVPTPQSEQFSDIAEWIKEDLQPSDSVLVIYESGTANYSSVRQMTAAIDSAAIRYSSLTYNILEGRDMTNRLENMMTKTGANRVFIASENEAFVNDVVRNLNVMIYSKYNVVLYAQSKIRTFDTIEVENFHNTNLHVSLGYYIDYSSDTVDSFIKKYRALFNTEPSQFAFQGYDIALYFIEMFSDYGEHWESMIEENRKDMLQSKFRFRRISDNGFQNTGIRRIVYGADYSVKML